MFSGYSFDVNHDLDLRESTLENATEDAILHKAWGNIKQKG